MKLIFLFLIISLIQVAASTKAQTITLNKQNISITAVFEEIMMQSDYDFSYSEQQISKVGRINISVTNASITEVLGECFQGQALTYTISNNTITIKDIPQPFFKRILKRFSTVIISGTVSDEQGNALRGATIRLQGSKTITRTDDKGFFSINSEEESGVLSISFLGYVSERISFSSNNLGPFKVILKQETSGLKEVEVNAGYYTVKYRERTGSISRVTSETISKQPINNPLQAMQGRIPGVEIIQTTGLPGGGFNVRIRGTNSIQNGNDPLYILNGVPMPSVSLSSNLNVTLGPTPNASPLSSINPTDIASIEVLKDADATAIYGSRGANGVILINTKKGKSSGLNLDANFYQGVGHVTRTIDLLNTEQYIEMRKEAFKNDNRNPGPADYDINGTWDQHRYTDWQKELIGGNSNLSNAQLSVSGGGINTTFLISGNYNRETTVFPGDKNYQRKSSFMNINHTSDDKKLKISSSVSYVMESSDMPQLDLTSSMNLAPNAPNLLTSDGKLNWENGTFFNPLAYLYRGYEAKTGTLTANGVLSYFIIPSLEFSTRLGFTRMNRNEVQTSPLSSQFSTTGLTATNRTANYADNWNQTFNLEPQLSWTGKLGLGQIKVLAGATIQNNTIHLQTLRGVGFVSDGIMKNIAAASTATVSNAMNADYRYLSAYGRINYSLKDKYYLNFTARRDGSSRFGPDNTYANFGAVGAAWIFSNESLISDYLNFLSFGKLRASYGITGNDQIGDYKYLELWGPTTNAYQGQSSLYPTLLSNPNFAWETNKKFEMAIELGILKDAIHFTAAYYNNRSSNQLVNYTLPPSTGYTSILRNFPATMSNYGWEFDAALKPIIKNDLKWNVNLNLSIPRNKLVSFPGLEKSTYAALYSIGESVNILKLYQYNQVDPLTGNYTFMDVDGNNLLNVNDRIAIRNMGSQYYGGLQNIFAYKGFEIDFLFQFVKQLGRNYTTNATSPGSSLSNQPTLVLDRWQAQNDVTNIQKYSVTSGSTSYSNLRISTLNISDASFIRLKNLALSYRLPVHIIKFLKASNIKTFLQAQNIMTITNYLGMDPESLKYNGLPPMQMVTAGLQVTF